MGELTAKNTTHDTASIQCRLPIEALYHAVEPSLLGFETTEELVPLDGTIGQDRAVIAIDFGLEIGDGDYNIYVAGASGSGRLETVLAHIRQRAAEALPADDWAYVHNFKDPYRPIALRLPAGKACELAQDLDGLVEAAKQDIPRAFESEEYERRKEDVGREIRDKQELLSQQIQKEAADRGFSVEATPAGIVTVPVVDGRALNQEEWDKLPDETKEEMRRKMDELRTEIGQALRTGRTFEKDLAERIRALDREVAQYAVGHFFDDLKAKYGAHPEVLRFLTEIQEDIPEHIHDFRVPPADHDHGAEARMEDAEREEHLSRYKVNVVVDNSDATGRPIVVENNPTYYNLIGRIDYRSRLGSMVTDFRQIRAGALHRANGGFLIMQAADLLTQPLAWDVLKRMLRAREVRIENALEQYSPIPTATLRPEPIPLHVKVVLVGLPYVYYLLYHHDEDFRKMFKVKADFSPDTPRDPDHVQAYAARIAETCKQHHLRPFHRSAVARIIEECSRMIEHQDRLSTRLVEINDLAIESSFWADKDGSPLVMEQHVNRAVTQKEYRSSFLEDRVQQLIGEGTLLIDSSGEKQGQINGLSISDLGDYSFGRPARITARVALGRGSMINIEREIKLSGPIHNKGFATLSGYLVGKFGRDKPLAFSASIGFEQMYDEIDGDSASSAELYVLLSALSGLTLKQGIAVTGSVNQHGEVQAVGGVTRKVEGFFDVCRMQGLTGDQGVIVPRANVKHLMLREEVRRAVEEGKFRIWAVSTVEEGIEILTGLPAGELQADETYPVGTVNYHVDQQLRQFADRLKQFGREGGVAPTVPISRLTPNGIEVGDKQPPRSRVRK
ncbi:MAG: ATP-binding protein [Chloroflexota bacterium]|nr:MAG: ATP-binding protein [Chloroflexota bacterium]